VRAGRSRERRRRMRARVMMTVEEAKKE